LDSNNLSNKIEAERHISTVNSNSINQAVERASKDRNFISKAVEQLRGLKFPVYKRQLIEYLKNNSAESETLALFESLNATMLYRDHYQVKKVFEQNNSEAKNEHQVSDKTRTNLDVKKVNSAHKRKDYPEVPATAMKEYVCDLCGKTFQARDDLIHHQEFEFKEKSEKS
jgi:chaperonin GroEL (HSP60 family)